MTSASGVKPSQVRSVRPDPVHLVDLERDEPERVAVRRGGRDRRVADHAGAARAVDDVHRLLEIALEHHGDLSRDRIRAAARGPRHDQRDRPLRKCGAALAHAGSERGRMAATEF